MLKKKDWLCIALRHQNADLAVRESYGLQETHRVLFEQKLIQNIQEKTAEIYKTTFQTKNIQVKTDIWCLITCNRCEVYIQYELDLDLDLDLELFKNQAQNQSQNQLQNQSQIHEFILNTTIETWAKTLNLQTKQLNKYLNIFEKYKAIEHLFEVACGLDSMNLGETQITHQIKQQMQASALQKVLQKSLETAKSVRTHTDISQYSISIAAIAMRLAKQIFSSISEQNLMIIGTGMMMQNILPYFLDEKPAALKILNRSAAGIEKLKNHFHKHAFFQNNIKDNVQNNQNINTIQSHAFPELNLKNFFNTHLENIDLLIVCTNSPDILLDKTMLQNHLKKRKHKPFFCIDLSLPRNIEPAAADIDNLFLYSIDDLGQMASQSQEKRLEAKAQAKHLIEKSLAEFINSHHQQEKYFLIKKINDYFDKMIKSNTENLDLTKKQQQAVRLVYKQQAHLWLAHIRDLDMAQSLRLYHNFNIF